MTLLDPLPLPLATQREPGLELHFPLGARRELRLERALSPTGVTLRLLGGSGELSVSLEARHPDAPFGTQAGMPLARFRTAAMAALRRSWLGMDGGSAWRRDVAQLRDSVAEAWCHLEPRLDPRAWERARRFSPRLRWTVYEALAADGTGRLAQLADAVPGALSFALVHALVADVQGMEAARAFRDAVISGRPVRHALLPLLENWALLASRVKLRGAARVLEALAAAPEPGRREYILRQRTLLRRAHAGVDARLVWLPPPLDFVPEDVPTALAAQQRWFHTMKGLLVNTWEPPRSKGRAQVAFIRWLSARAAEPLPGGWTPELLHSGVARWGAVLPRSLPTQRLVDKLDAWEREFWEQHHRIEMELEAEALGCAFPNELLEDLDVEPEPPWPERLQSLAAAHPDRVLLDGKGELDLLLPNPFGEFELPGLSVVPLVTASALEVEGRAMKHCVAYRVEDGLRGDAFFFHAVAAGTELTVEVHGPAAKARLAYFLGERNWEPGPEQRALVLAWWEQLARAHGLDPTVPEPAPPDEESPF